MEEGEQTCRGHKHSGRKKNGELGDLQPSVQSISGHLQMQLSNLWK